MLSAVYKFLLLCFLSVILPFLIIRRKAAHQRFVETFVFAYGLAACKFVDCLWLDSYRNIFYPRFDWGLFNGNAWKSLLVLLLGLICLLILLYYLINCSSEKVQDQQTPAGKRYWHMFLCFLLSFAALSLVLIPDVLWGPV
jgi:hypothetical protein